MKRILNVGCGNETYGTHFVDLYPQRKEVIKVDVDWEKLPFPDNYFDEVYSKNLLEHLKNPGFVLKEMVRVLKKGGTLKLITDNASYYLFHLIKSHSAHYYNYHELGEEDRHYSLFTEVHLRNFCKWLKLKIIKLEFITWFEPPNKIIKFPGKNSKLFLINRLLYLFLPKQMVFPRILLVAKKI